MGYKQNSTVRVHSNSFYCLVLFLFALIYLHKQKMKMPHNDWGIMTIQASNLSVLLLTVKLYPLFLFLGLQGRVTPKQADESFHS